MAWTGYTGGAKEDNRTSALGNTKKVTAADMNAISEALTDHEQRNTTLLIDTLNFDDADFIATADKYFSRNVVNIKPAGYAIVGAYIDIVTPFVNNGTSLSQFAIDIGTSGLASSGRRQLIHRQTNIGGYPSTLSSSTAATVSARYISIDETASVSIYYKTDVTISTGDFSAGQAKYYLILTKIS